MKNLKDIILEKLVINKNTKIDKYHYHPKDKSELKKIVKQLIDERGDEADLNDIDTSEITNMTNLFSNSKFNGDISKWNVSNVKCMDYMFAYANFDGDISNWDVSNVNNMSHMFYNSKFTGRNGDISNWDVSNVNNMSHIFVNSHLIYDPSWF